ncbi:MAG: sigma 54-interacting transcriptional regulator [Leptospirales bacterium]|nr:sigma 54-interacting transcriptional regulator [Leptospirales bacterium]
METPVVVILIQGFSGGSLFLLTLFVIWKKRPLLPVLPFLLMTGCCSLWVLVDAMRVWTAYAQGPVHLVSPIAGMLVVLTGWTVLNFGARFHAKPDRNRIRILTITFIVALCVSMLTWTDTWSYNRRFDRGMPVADNGWPYFVTAGYAFLQILAGLGYLLRRYLREDLPIRKAQILYCILGIAIFTFCAYLFSLVLPLLNLKHLFFLGPSSGIIFVGILSWAILTRQFFSIRAAALTSVLALVYFIVFSLGFFLATSPFISSNSISGSTRLYLAFGFAMVLSYFYLKKLHPYLERKAARYSVDVNELIRSIVNTTTAFALRQYDFLCSRIAQSFLEILRIEKAIVCYENEDKQIIALSVNGRNERFQKVLRKHHRILHSITPRLFRESAPVSFWVEDIAGIQSLVRPNRHPRMTRIIDAFRDDLMALGIDLFLPVSYQNRFLAHIFLGRKKNGEPYYTKEVSRITGLSGVIAVALKNSQVFSELLRLKESLKTENEALIHSSSILTQKIVSLSEDRKIIYSGPAMAAVVESIEKTALSDETALILGESGTGKELFALMIHEKSARAKKAFLSLNCGTLNDSLLQSELFGHEKGAFTGAIDRHLGVFEQASGGTLFLDEIGEMSVAVQVKFLRVLQEKKITRVGGTQEIKVDTRIIAATNADLKKMVDAGTFRLDLFYRLNVMNISLPPLRTRKEDIPVLVDHYLSAFAEKLSKGKKEITMDAMQLLQEYEWPGNIRQLENALLRAIISANSTTLTVSDFAELVPSGSRSPGPDMEESNLLEKSEIQSIKTAMEKSAGNKSHAAKILGLSRSTFYLKLRKYGLS